MIIGYWDCLFFNFFGSIQLFLGGSGS